MIKFPQAPKYGDKVFLICTSSPILPEEIEKCKQIIKNLGFYPVAGKSLSQNIGGYMAGSADIRINDLHEAFSNPEIKAIFCVKGGFSSSQLLDKIDYELIKKNPKLFVGYSDVTNLNVVFNQKCELGTYHGPMIRSNMLYDFNEFTKKSFLFSINKKNEEKWELENPNSKKLNLLNKNNFIEIEIKREKEVIEKEKIAKEKEKEREKKKKEKEKENKEQIKKEIKSKFREIQGELIGGNLSLLVTTLGTDYEIDTKDKILFIEEIEEEISRIDRMMTHLKLSGKFDDCCAVLFGNFDGCENTYDPNYTLDDFLNNFFKDFKKPVITGIECGHKKPDLVTLPLGAECTINIDKNFDNIKIYFKK